MYQTKYNEVNRDMELGIKALEDRIKASQSEKPKTEEQKVEETAS